MSDKLAPKEKKKTRNKIYQEDLLETHALPAPFPGMNNVVNS